MSQSQLRNVTFWTLRNIAFVSWEVRDMIDGSVKRIFELHSSHVIVRRSKIVIENNNE